MNEDELLHRYGQRPAAEHLDCIRDLLMAESERERRTQGSGDTEAMQLCCVQLFNVGVMSDLLTIWGAKTSSWDAFCSIDVQLLCGAGLAETKAYLAAEGSEQAADALDHIHGCEAAGEFADFSVERQAASFTDHYNA